MDNFILGVLLGGGLMLTMHAAIDMNRNNLCAEAHDVYTCESVWQPVAPGAKHADP